MNHIFSPIVWSCRAVMWLSLLGLSRPAAPRMVPWRCLFELFISLSLSLQNIEHRKYAKWKATYIHNCLKRGETPQAGPIGMEGEMYGKFWYNISTSFHKQLELCLLLRKYTQTQGFFCTQAEKVSSLCTLSDSERPTGEHFPAPSAAGRCCQLGSCFSLEVCRSDLLIRVIHVFQFESDGTKWLQKCTILLRSSLPFLCVHFGIVKRF